MNNAGQPQIEQPQMQRPPNQLQPLQSNQMQNQPNPPNSSGFLGNIYQPKDYFSPENQFQQESTSFFETLKKMADPNSNAAQATAVNGLGPSGWNGNLNEWGGSPAMRQQQQQPQPPTLNQRN
jgi:hypothetical protein